LIEKVYGVFNYQHLKSIKKANSYITNPDIIAANRLIDIPAIAVTVKPLPENIWWVKVGQKDRLDDAIQALRSYPDTAAPIRLIPYWNRRQELKFALILRQYFRDETLARQQLERLPAAVASKGEIFTAWDRDTVFFADPYLLQRQ